VKLIAYERTTLSDWRKVYWLHVHQATIPVAVMDASGKLVMESGLETEASILFQILAGFRGNLPVRTRHGLPGCYLQNMRKAYQ
jgi:hypothetical protein